MLAFLYLSRGISMIDQTAETAWLTGIESGPVIGYAAGEWAWRNYDAFLRRIIASHRVRSVCEIGGGANPAFPLEYVAERELDYLILDLSQDELDKAPSGYRKVQADIVQAAPGGERGFDLVFSKMLAEHVLDGERFHRNVGELLRPGGIAVHFFPTLYAPPFVLNALLPERLAEFVLHIVQTGRERTGKRAKFPAYYHWCRGPTSRQVERFESLGFEIERYIGFFGHAGYFRKVPTLERAHRYFATWLVKHPFPQITSFTWVVLRKPL